MTKLVVLFLFFQSVLFSQEIKLFGIIKDNQNRSVSSASVVVLDNNENTLGYCYSEENGNYNLVFDKPSANNIMVLFSSLGYTKKEITVDLTSKKEFYLTVELEEKIEALNEIVIASDKKIKIDHDTTTIKIAKFGNNTEQTVEDILKKLPGIEVLKDGSIKAHGKSIDKLLVEGEDIFDNNYKMLSKNLDAKVLDAVQILDNYEDNPILKKMSNSDKVALNLKLKKDKQNVWFGNIMLGAGVISENRWKEGINLGLLRKKIKLFCLADYNNSGEKATDQLSTAINDNNIFGEDRYEKTTKLLYNISSNENNTFSKSQTVFNKALFNSLSFTTKVKSKVTMRGVGYFANDIQVQNSFSQTKYAIDDISPIVNSEANNFYNRKTIASGEFEFKYYADQDNYITNLFIYKSNPNSISSDLIFNDSQISQSSKSKNQTFYNHLNHTYKLTDTKVLLNYVYFGNDNSNQKSKITSPLLNTFLNANTNDLVSQNANNSLLYFGLKSKLISRYNKLQHILAVQIDNNKEIKENDFLVNNNNNSVYENSTKLKQVQFSVDNALKYSFSKKIEFTTSLNYTQNHFNINAAANNKNVLNPKAVLEIKKSIFGTFVFSFSENSTFPEINFLTTNYQLTDYRNFTKGTSYQNPIKNSVYSIMYTIYNDEKRFSINTNFVYLKSKSTYITENNITNNFNFGNYNLIDGGKNYNWSFNIINYFRKLKLATKLETFQSWNESLAKANSNVFIGLKAYSGIYKFSGTTYFKLPVNFDFGFGYNSSQTNFNNTISKNNSKDAFVNINYKITKTWLAELNSNFYYVSNKNYSFVNTIVNYTPENSKFSYRFILNNITNQNEFTITTLDNYITYKSSINLVPRYLLVTAKYRF